MAAAQYFDQKSQSMKSCGGTEGWCMNHDCSTLYFGGSVDGMHSWFRERTPCCKGKGPPQVNIDQHLEKELDQMTAMQSALINNEANDQREISLLIVLVALALLGGSCLGYLYLEERHVRVAAMGQAAAEEMVGLKKAANARGANGAQALGPPVVVVGGGTVALGPP